MLWATYISWIQDSAWILVITFFRPNEIKQNQPIIFHHHATTTRYHHFASTPFPPAASIHVTWVANQNLLQKEPSIHAHPFTLSPCSSFDQTAKLWRMSTHHTTATNHHCYRASHTTTESYRNSTKLGLLNLFGHSIYTATLTVTLTQLHLK